MAEGREVVREGSGAATMRTRPLRMLNLWDRYPALRLEAGTEA